MSIREIFSIPFLVFALFVSLLLLMYLAKIHPKIKYSHFEAWVKKFQTYIKNMFIDVIFSATIWVLFFVSFIL